jgi:hypothetical protein
LNYEDFKEEFMNAVKQGLYEKGLEVDVATHQVEKPNASYESLTIKPVDSPIGVHTNMEHYFHMVEDGADFNDVVRGAVETAAKGIQEAPDFNIDSLTDYCKMKDTPEQLHADAMENSPKLKPAEITGMSEIIAQMMGSEMAEMMELSLRILLMSRCLWLLHRTRFTEQEFLLIRISWIRPLKGLEARSLFSQAVSMRSFLCQTMVRWEQRNLRTWSAMVRLHKNNL